ncbi:methylated-DNA--[protein]-cysteine S-methyltransferase [Polyangium aurulentum]|uniref:methylated-DNA--[protein]-cysteine S-methyltransferase n=1 Tax=Polyangium aurulentum TaxID=2567896 RepID=UPI0010AE42FE|nr:methylated-DNA--[protein]-cysteine S-methyltransferase [Polyangium aurulentum]UQA57748.1 methylated-DNA--[protein]-cysteine S-methyltransferase [Polyangium aurulentum]
MTAIGYALFETPLGWAAVAWSERGLYAVELPVGSAEATEKRLCKLVPGARAADPPAWAVDAMRAITAHLGGERVDLGAIPVDVERMPAFYRTVYEAARAIAPGQTVTYGELAARCGSPGAARAVGQALAKNPVPVVVPCHRILAAGGAAGGFSAAGGLDTKARLLAIEGVSMRRAENLAFAFDDPPGSADPKARK